MIEKENGSLVVKIRVNERICELGGGDTPGFCKIGGSFGIGTNVDVRVMPTVDIVTDLEKPLPIPNESFDFVYSRYTIEHVSWRNVKQFISEIFRILAWGGRTVVIMPNLYEQCKVIANSTEWEENFSCMLFGDQNYGENSHKNGMSPAYAKKLFDESGFNGVEVFPLPGCHTDMIVQGWKK